jgi:polysaccharide pyruvyl transferase WcaK-like protein
MPLHSSERPLRRVVTRFAPSTRKAVARALPMALRGRLIRMLGARSVESKRRPVLGLAGFFGAGNFGDELFLEVFEQYLAEDFELRVLADLPSHPFYSQDVKKIVAEVDAILIGGGDILQPWGQDPRYFNPAFLTKPVFIVGVGVPLYSGPRAKPARPEIIAQHRSFMQHQNVRHIGVRDNQTAEWVCSHISPLIDVRIAPDIVCALDLPEATKPPGPPILGVVTRFRPNRAEPDDYSEVARLASAMIADGWRVRHIILGVGEVGRRDRANADDLNVPQKEIVASDSLADLSVAIGECTALASMKFHGSVVATMYAVPSIVMIPTNKNRNFMRRLRLESLISSFDSPNLTETFHQRPEVPPAECARLRRDAEAHMIALRNCILSELSFQTQ